MECPLRFMSFLSYFLNYRAFHVTKGVKNVRPCYCGYQRHLGLCLGPPQCTGNHSWSLYQISKVIPRQHGWFSVFLAFTSCTSWLWPDIRSITSLCGSLDTVYASETNLRIATTTPFTIIIKSVLSSVWWPCVHSLSMVLGPSSLTEAVYIKDHIP